MSFIRRKVKGIKPYYELVESVRINGKVKQRVLKYLGDRKKMSDYARSHKVKPPKEESVDRPTCTRLEQKLARLNSLRPLPPASVESLRKKFEVEMTYNSNAIEGNRLSLRETFLVLEKGITIGGKSVQEHLEATNHREAIAFLEKLARAKQAVSEKDILDLHATILDKIDMQNAGSYRREQVYITGTSHLPPNWKEVPERMKAALKELNSTSKGCEAIKSAARLHHLIAWIHPFIDGNGRLARLLTNLRLMRAGFPPIVLRKQVRKSYYSALEQADRGDLSPLVLLLAKDTEAALDLWLDAAK